LASLASPNIFPFIDILYSPDLINLPNLEKNIILLLFWHCFSQKWHLANVGKSGESSQNGLANAGESGESKQNCSANVGEFGESSIFQKKAIFANASTCQKWIFFVKYLHSLNSRASSHCLIRKQIISVIATTLDIVIIIIIMTKSKMSLISS
jgi:hypothetical protein